MKRQTLLAGLVGAMLSTAVLASDAWSAVVERTITLQRGTTVSTIDRLMTGDTVVLNLINPTGSPLTFRTDRPLGPDSMWVIPANSRQTVTFQYTQPMVSDVGYTVEDATGTVLAQGMLIPADQTIRPVSEQAPATIRGYW